MESILNSGLLHISEKIFRCLDNISLANFGLACRFSLNHELKLFIEDIVTINIFQKYNQILNRKQWNFIIQSLIKGWQRYSLILYQLRNCSYIILI